MAKISEFKEIGKNCKNNFNLLMIMNKKRFTAHQYLYKVIIYD